MKKMYSVLVGALLLTSTPLMAQEADAWKAGVDTLDAVIKKNPKAAEDLVKVYTKGNKKNLEFLYAVGQAYLAADQVPVAQEYVEKLRKANSKDARSYLLEGDIKLHNNDAGGAAQMYANAQYFDPNNKEALVKQALIYKKANPDECIRLLKELQQKDPSYAGVNRQLATLYFDKGDYKSAAIYFDSLIKSPEARESEFANYAVSLLQANDAAKAKSVSEAGVQKYPNSVPCQRLAMYADITLKDTDAAAKSVERYFKSTPADKLIAYDYIYRATFYQLTKQFDKAAQDYENLYAKDPKQYAVLANAADVYEDEGQYDKAISIYDTYLKALASNGKQPQAADLYKKGHLLYARASQENTSADVKAKDYAAAAQAFAEVDKLEPDNYMGSFWQGRVAAALDPDAKAATAKPFYTKALQLLDAKNDPAKYSSQIVECLKYLGYAAYQAKDIKTAKENWQRILTLDPNNEVKEALTHLK